MTDIDKKPIKTKGGVRPNSGRKPGSMNKKTAQLQKAVEDSGVTPLEYMLSVMRCEGEDMRVRLNAAIASAPYVHAKLSSIELSGQDGGAIQMQFNVKFD